MGRTSDVRCEGESIVSPIDLDWDEIANYGTDSAVGGYLLNSDGDTGKLMTRSKIESCEVSVGENLTRKHQG